MNKPSPEFLPSLFNEGDEDRSIVIQIFSPNHETIHIYCTQSDLRSVLLGEPVWDADPDTDLDRTPLNH